MPASYYTPSGRVPRAAFVVALGTIAAAMPAAWLYGWTTAGAGIGFAPLWTMVFALFLGYLGRAVALHGKVRHPAWAARFGAAVGLAGWYVQWAAWLAYTLAGSAPASGGGTAIEPFLALAAQPGALLAEAVDAARTGTFSLRGTPVTGAVLGVVWLLEAGLFLMLPAGLARLRAGQPFCEASDAWTTAVDVPGRFAFIDDTQAAIGMLERDPHALTALLAPRRDDGAGDHARVTAYACPGEDCYVSVCNVTSRPVDGKDEETRDWLVVNLHVPGLVGDTLARGLAAITTATASPERAAETPAAG